MANRENQTLPCPGCAHSGGASGPSGADPIRGEAPHDATGVNFSDAGSKLAQTATPAPRRPTRLFRLRQPGAGQTMPPTNMPCPQAGHFFVVSTTGFDASLAPPRLQNMAPCFLNTRLQPHFFHLAGTT
jgi:hypothetical protein